MHPIHEVNDVDARNLGMLCFARESDQSKYGDVTTCFYAFSDIPISLFN